MELDLNKEWLVTNGLGGYASGTVSGANTRQYHGLLVSAENPPTDRKIVVSKIEERIGVNGEFFDLSTNQYPSRIHPKGYKLLKQFNRSPIATWVYENNQMKLVKTISMVDGSNTTVLTYQNQGQHTITLELHPLYSYTRFHDFFRENKKTVFSSTRLKNGLITYPYKGAQPIYTNWSGGEFVELPCWYKNLVLKNEVERGTGKSADYFQIGVLKKELQPNELLTLRFSTDDHLAKTPILPPLKTTPVSLSFFEDLLKSGEQFLVNRESTGTKTIIAGYHWFTDWGRDTMISMRGLTIATKKKKLSKSILVTFLKTVNQGMLPNRFPDNSSDEVEYNSIDSALWLFVSLFDYYKTFHDKAFVKGQMSVLHEIILNHIHGTRYNIHVTEEGFLSGGEDGIQLTWMDAKVNGLVITPRMGCPVEINALWYNALRIYGFFCDEFQLQKDELFETVQSNFQANFEKYFLTQAGTLYDVIVPNESSDSSFRPNQLYCLSLPFNILPKTQEVVIFEAIKNKLFTFFGLRTLDQGDDNFISEYQGNQWHRDHAYHQGTVWPFLLGEYYEAFFKLYGATEENKKKVVSELADLRTHFYNNEGIHCISEIFDGNNPKEGKGTIQQAWSVSALIKLYVDYKLYEIK